MVKPDQSAGKGSHLRYGLNFKQTKFPVTTTFRIGLFRLISNLNLPRVEKEVQTFFLLEILDFTARRSSSAEHALT